jgi:hypothetical protein
LPLVSILRAPAAFDADTSARRKRTVTFSIPAPRIQDDAHSFLQLGLGASHRPVPASPAAGGSWSSSDSEGWTRVLS